MVQRLLLWRWIRVPRASLLLVLALILAACSAGGPASTLVPTALITPNTPTIAALPTSTPGTTSILPVAEPSVVPTPTIAPLATPPASPVPATPASNVGGSPTPWPIPEYVTDEIAAYFASFYQARMLQPGGAFDIAGLRDMTAPPYRHYTVSLLERDQNDADAGRLVSVYYSDIVTTVADWQPSPDGTGSVSATVTRTLRETRANGARAPQTATHRFKLYRYLDSQQRAAWAARDFYDPAVGAWVSQGVSFGALSPEAEVATFFRQFYAAREVQAGAQFDPMTAVQQNRFAYAAYQWPQLERQRDEVARGDLISITYSDIRVALVEWAPFASNHGGMATVDVTRTRQIVRPGGSETTRETVRFRVHRHLGTAERSMWESNYGEPLWFAIDFRDPAIGQWVSSAGWESRGSNTTEPLPVDDFFG
jgi:hypothetical protein